MNEIPTSNFLCCRTCLATEGKLLNMHEYNLAKEFYWVTRKSVKETMLKHTLSQHLCFGCAAVLKRCAAFRAKCQRAKTCLRNHLSNGLTPTESVKTTDRLAYKLVNLTQTEVNIIEITETPVLHVKEEPILRSMTLDNDNELKKVINDTLYSEVNTEKLNGIKFDPPEENYIKELNTDIEDEYEVEYLDFDDIEIFGPDIETIDAEIPTKEPDAENDITRLKSKSTNKRKKVVSKRRRSGEERKRPKGGQKSWAEDCDIALFDYKKFESAYDVKILSFNEEEQKTHLEERRKTAEFRRAAFKCEPCAKPFSLEQAYANHQARHHESTGPFVCAVCTVRFRVRGKRTSHVNSTHRFKFVCNKCGFVSQSRPKAKEHYQFHAGKTYQCGHCGKTFKKSTTYFGHLRLTHPQQNVVCTMCGEPFVSDVGLKLHMAKVHAVVTQAHMLKRMQCQTCSIMFASLHALRKHKEGEHTAHSCSLCGENFHTEDSLKEHSDQHPRCEECAATFLNEAAFTWHVQRKHRGCRLGADGRPALPRGQRALREFRDPRAPRRAPPRLNTGYVAFCEICGKMCKNSTLLRYHQATAHKIGVLPHRCQLCPRRFPSNHHMRVHTGERPYECADCTTSFTMKSNLQRHILAVHMGKRERVPCELCGRVLSCRGSVQPHVRSVHMGLKVTRKPRQRAQRGSETSKRVNRRASKPLSDSLSTESTASK